MDAKKVLMSVGAAIASNKLARSVSSSISDLEADDVLALIGLQRRRTPVLESLALIGLGAIVGAGAALLLAPASGRETRERLGRELGKLGDAASEAAREAAREIQNEAPNLLSRVGIEQETRRANSHDS
jgi:hypothetical protein